jgi:deoxyguanosine kinase
MSKKEIVMDSKDQTVILGLGSNLGDRLENMAFAIEKLSEEPEIKVLACSSIYESKAMDFKGDKFYNLTLSLTCTLSPVTLLNFTQHIEILLGRESNTKGNRSGKYSSRKLDIDILYYGNIILNTTRLIIPHPEINKRLFVTKPLQDLNFLLPSHCINKKETNDVLLKSEGVEKLKLISEQLKTRLKPMELLK